MLDHLFKDKRSLKLITSKTSFVNERASLVTVVRDVVSIEANDSCVEPWSKPGDGGRIVNDRSEEILKHALMSEVILVKVVLNSMGRSRENFFLRRMLSLTTSSCGRQILQGN